MLIKTYRIDIYINVQFAHLPYDSKSEIIQRATAILKSVLEVKITPNQFWTTSKSIKLTSVIEVQFAKTPQFMLQRANLRLGK